VIGAEKVSQLEDNLASVDIQWTEEALAKVGQATALSPLYPHWMAAMSRRK
jgi:aryl-alcohol dehydrogenase-like predicted oxidoreductase